MNKAKLSLGARFGLAVASFILGVLLLISALVTTLLADVRTILTEDNIKLIIHQTLSAPAAPRRINAPIRNGNASYGAGIVRKAPIRLEATDSLDTTTTGSEDTTDTQASSSLLYTLVEQFYNEFASQSEEPLPVTLETINILIEQSTIPEYIADKAASLVVDFCTGEITTTFEPEEIQELIEENVHLIEQATGEPFLEEYTQGVVTWFDESEVIETLEDKGIVGILEETVIPGIVGSGNTLPDNENPGDALPDSGVTEDETQSGNHSSGALPSIFQDLFGGTVDNDSPESFTPATNIINNIIAFLQGIISPTTLYVGITICLLLMVAIILINIKQLSKGLRRSGYPLLFAGILFVACMVVQSTPDLWQTKEMSLVRSIILMTTNVNAVAPAVGLVMVIAGIVLGIISTVNAKKVVAAPVQVAELAETDTAEEVAVEATVVSEETAVSKEESTEEVAAPEEVAVSEETAPAEEVATAEEPTVSEAEIPAEV